MDMVSAVVPSLDRHDSLRRALTSLSAQKLGPGLSLEIIVVDNSQDANARPLVEELAISPSAHHPIVYISEPQPGISTARNAGVRAAKGQWIAFLDDDEEAEQDWAAELVRIARTSGADAVFGPVNAKSGGASLPEALAPYFSRSIEAGDGSDVTALAAYLGTNNSMFVRETCFAGAAPFDESLNETGGEDSLLLQRLVLQGRRFAWASGAGVSEWAAQRRLNWAYVRKRKFLSGQIRVFVQQMSVPGRWDRIALWMSVGLVQFLAGGLAALLLWPLDRNRAAKASATAWGGLGKLFWTARFRPKLYGSGLVS
ncbi:MAG: glycosyltransferase family 2 protein [Hyphomicrobiales bacterium]|nr:glycosyltransferase family 2 protein [Hyphomicrobiales bacterium]